MGLSSVQKQPGVGCHCKNEDLFAPIKSKMKVLKKIKKRMGLAPRNTTSCPGPNNLPPLQFHQVHGDNIRICRDGTMAKRHESFCKGITFSARPVKINERVYVKFSEISNNWSGVIRFGFTCNDPATLRNTLPKYACPDLTNRPGYWAKALNERFCERDNILFYYVTATGDVHFGINGEEKGVFINGVETRGPLWTLIDIYGNCSAIEFLDSRIYMYQQQNHHARRSGEAVLDTIIPTFQSVSINEETPAVSRSCADINRWCSNSNGLNGLTPIPFHRTKGRNIGLSTDRFVATRADTEFCQGYVFTARPLRIGENIIVQILRTEHMYVGALALGLTSCDPASLQSTDLPDDSDMLLDRPEYWVVSKDVASTPVRGDEICFCVTAAGEVQISKNGGPATIVMHVDQSLQLWAFLDVYGSTQSVRLFSQPITSIMTTTSPRRLQIPMPSSESVNSLNSQVSQQSENQRKIAQMTAQRLISVPSTGDMILQTGGTVLVVNLPPAHPTEVLPTAAPRRQQSQVAVPCTSATLLSNYSNTYDEPINVQQQQNFNNRNDVSQPLAGVVTSPQRLQVQLPSTESVNSLNAQMTQQTDNQRKAVQLAAHQNAADSSIQCYICYENPIDSVLYMCGHMCMCYNCAIQQWRGIGGGHCPLCRAVIRDVIRTYKS